MSKSYTEYHRDHVEDELEDDVDNLYDNLSSDWSRTIPVDFQSEEYYPNRLNVSIGYKDEYNVRIPLYKKLNSSSQFLGIIATSNGRDVNISTFLVKVEHKEIVSMDEPERMIINEFEVNCQNKSFTDVIDDVLTKINKIVDDYEDKSVKYLISETK